MRKRVVLVAAIAALVAGTVVAQARGGGVTPADYSPYGDVVDLELGERAKREGVGRNDDSTGGVVSSADPDDVRITLPKVDPCEINPALEGCPGYKQPPVNPPPPTGPPQVQLDHCGMPLPNRFEECLPVAGGYDCSHAGKGMGMVVCQ